MSVIRDQAGKSFRGGVCRAKSAPANGGEIQGRDAPALQRSVFWER